MATDLDNLKTRRTAITTELASLVGKPSYSIDGQSVQWNEYRKSLLDEFKSLNELITMLEPYEYAIVGTT